MTKPVPGGLTKGRLWGLRKKSKTSATGDASRTEISNVAMWESHQIVLLLNKVIVVERIRLSKLQTS